MGDRCWLQVTLHGQITSMRQLAAVVMAFKADSGFSDNMYGRTLDSRAAIIGVIVRALNGNENPEFTDDERNYANVEDVETALQAAQVTYSVDHADGGGYAGACWCWQPGDTKHEAHQLGGGGGVAIEVWRLREALGKPEALKAIEAMVESSERAQGRDIPAFSIACERVERYLAKYQAMEALGVEP